MKKDEVAPSGSKKTFSLFQEKNIILLKKTKLLQIVPQARRNLRHSQANQENEKNCNKKKCAKKFNYHGMKFAKVCIYGYIYTKVSKKEMFFIRFCILYKNQTIASHEKITLHHLHPIHT